ncbi:ATP-dependent nuclease [Plebeiibacterium sediminum]|uniref:ATP-binding protein n=1 Tax=Plebeiibacterium sediminum TaxID=2992112 RepID=A0AAE3M217_9BACT|nr:AAA family ATPase [Plebeiobacterium sediminum]MCW3785289.1 ATP-binding protein [Plebeiobacterium sediminum]
MKYKYDQKPNTSFTEKARKCIEEIKNADYSVFVGRNNCGKSYILKTLTQSFGKQASYLGPARYQNFHILGMYTPKSNKKDEKWRQFIQQWQHQQQNIDNSPINLQQAIAELSDMQRDKLFEIVKNLLGTDLKILYTVEDNTMSQKYISCDGHNISYTSSGFRLITTLVTCMLDTDYDTFLIDEPELGISPEAQGILADFLFDREQRKKYFGHIKRLIFATHSTIFLDRLKISNNYSIKKDGDIIDISKTDTISDFNNIHFFLLGNRLESLFLPSCIILTEGKCDQHYLTKVLESKYPNSQFSILNANSDSRMKELVNVAGNIFTDLQKSPYRNRIIAVLDKVHDTSVKQTLLKYGIPESNILVWDKNGIEYYYPNEIMDSIFGSDNEIAITGDLVSRNGVSYKKWELCEKVVSKIDSSTRFNGEVEVKLLKTIELILGN